MTQQPSRTRAEQLTAALDAARHIAEHIPPADIPAAVEARTHGAFTSESAQGWAVDVIGVLLHSVPDTAALARLQTLFGGVITPVPVGASQTCEAYVEHRLIGEVQDVPYLATCRTDFGPRPLPRRRRAATPPDMVRVPIELVGDGGRAAEKAALDLVTASLDTDLEPGALEYAHYVLHPEPDPATLACLLAHTDLQPDDPNLTAHTTAHATVQTAGA